MRAATTAQINYATGLRARTGADGPSPETLNRAELSAEIDRLLTIEQGPPPPPQPDPIHAQTDGPTTLCNHCREIIRYCHAPDLFCDDHCRQLYHSAK